MYYHSIKKLKTKYSSIKDWATYENAIYNEILCKCKKMYIHIARKKVHTILRWKNQVSMLNKGCSPVAQTVKNLPAMWETWVQTLGQKDPLEKSGNPLQYSCLENPRDRGARGLPSTGSQSWTWLRDLAATASFWKLPVFHGSWFLPHTTFSSVSVVTPLTPLR